MRFSLSALQFGKELLEVKSNAEEKQFGREKQTKQKKDNRIRKRRHRKTLVKTTGNLRSLPMQFLYFLSA